MGTGKSHFMSDTISLTVICNMDGRKQGWSIGNHLKCHKCFPTGDVPSSLHRVSTSFLFYFTF